MGSNNNFKIALADDHHVFREGIKLLLESLPGYQVVIEICTCQELEKLLDTSEVDILICDYKMPGGDSLPYLQQLKNQRKDLKIMVLTGINAGALYQKLLKIPVEAILSKENSATEILSSLNAVIAGEQVISPQVREKIDVLNAQLTRRELQIVEHIVKGYNNKEIADNLNISAKTAENHRGNIFRKLNVKNAMELANYAREKGFIL